MTEISIHPKQVIYPRPKNIDRFPSIHYILCLYLQYTVGKTHDPVTGIRSITGGIILNSFISITIHLYAATHPLTNSAAPG